MTNEPQAHPSLATAGRPVTLVDSRVVLDIVTEDPAWAERSAEAPTIAIVAIVEIWCLTEE